MKKNGLEAGETFIRRFEDPKNFTRLSPDEKRKAAAEMRHGLAEQKAELVLARAELKDEAAEALYRIDRGYASGDLSALSARARRLGDDKLAERLEGAEAVRSEISIMARLPFAEQAAMVKKAEDEARSGGGANAVRRAEALTRVHANALADFKNDPIAHSGAAGLENFTALDWGQPESLAGRARQVERLAVKQGVHDLPPMTNREAEGLAEKLRSGSHQEQARLLGNLQQGLGPRYFTRALGQIKEKAPEAAQAGAAYLEGAPDVARDILFGGELRRTNGQDGRPRLTAFLRTAVAWRSARPMTTTSPTSRPRLEQGSRIRSARWLTDWATR